MAPRELTILPGGRIFVALTAEESAAADGPHPGRALAGNPKLTVADLRGLPIPILAWRPHERLSGQDTGYTIAVADEEYRSVVAAADAGDPAAQQALSYLFSDRDTDLVPFPQDVTEEQ